MFIVCFQKTIDNEQPCPTVTDRWSLRTTDAAAAAAASAVRGWAATGAINLQLFYFSNKKEQKRVSNSAMAEEEKGKA